MLHNDDTTPAAGFLVITLALAFPFCGVINSFLGAGTTTLETYIIPALAYNWVYRRESAQIACPAPPPWYVHHPHLLYRLIFLVRCIILVCCINS